MSEIPEHLLKRSKQAKAAKLGGEAPTETDSSTTAVTPSAGASAVQSSAPAEVVIPTADLPYLEPEPETNQEEPEYITAAKSRKKIPMWALPAVAGLPIWAWGFAGTIQEPEREDPLFIEAAAWYSDKGCSGCHGANGGGGLGYAFTGGSIVETFPEPIDHIVHVARGSADISGQEYGGERSDGRRVSGSRGNMPGQLENLSLEELEAIVFHERAVLSDEDTSSPEYQEWIDHMREAVESGSETEIDLDLLLACANPEFTPEATGAGSPDPENQPCPGPPTAEATEES